MNQDSAQPTPIPSIDRIQQVLASTGTPGTFATRRVASIDALHLNVTGIGPIPLPLSPTMARRLSRVASPARYGLRDQTLLDSRVRDTWEIGKRQIKIDARRWRRTLDPELEHVARELGLPAGAKLRAELHNLLIYGPGQFFATHQDSEKADGMIGSLVVLLPSDAKGGTLVITHHDEKVRYRGSADRLELIAFYADCHHEVRPVTAGYRAALTYNLFLDGATHAVRRPAGKPLDLLVDLVRGHFATPRPTHGWQRASVGCPERLVYLLDHEYTQKGLSWRRLKNGDAVRASLLREVADRLDCEIVLALADVHETWSCEDDWGYDGYGYGGRRRRGWYARGSEVERDEEADEEDDEGARGGEEYTLIELCNSDIELRHWLSASGKHVQAISSEVLGDEVCYTKPSVDLAPFRSEHEGYTGNAGNTVDRWYHRAAVLMWPRARTFAIRAKAAPSWGIREVGKALARGAAGVAKHELGELLPFWNEVAPREPAAGFVDQVLHVAAEVDDAQLAAELVAPIEIERVTSQMATRWVDLLARYGLTWCWHVFERWTSRGARGYAHQGRATWLRGLPELCAPLCARGGTDAIELVRRLCRAHWAWMDAPIGQLCDSPPSSDTLQRIEGLSPAIIGLLAAAGLAGDRDLQSTIAERLMTERGYPIAGTLAVLRAGAAHDGTVLGLGVLHEDCTRTLSRLADAPPRAPGDWSIATEIRCKCELCARLTRFLRAANEQQLDWRLAKDGRAHVHQTITSYELPVTHVTRRVGSPYTLVLTKTEALFKRDAAERAAWTRGLAWLRQTARTFTTQVARAASSARRPRSGGRPPG